MKKILLSIFTLLAISTSVNAQTFDWEGGTTINGGGTYVRQTISGVQAECTNPSNDLQHINGNGFAGSTGYLVSSVSNTTSLTVTFDAAINIQSIYALDGNATPADNWTFTPVGGTNSNVVQSIGGSTGVNVNVNWANVTAFTITSANGVERFAIDDIVFTMPCLVNIPDANFEAYLVGNTAINTNGDTEIQCSEATAFTGIINCSSLSISDLTGIEAFTDLSQLDCANNQLTSLDVSSNTTLGYLHCDNNELTSLDVSSNTTLVDLRCYINQLTSLDVSQNTNLRSLYCGDNQLSSLDVSLNTSLTRFYCGNSQLSSLNLANGNNSNFIGFYAVNNPNLTCITVDNIAYSTTNWTNIDAQTNFSLNCTLGTNEYQLQDITIYPNPVNNILNIQSEDALEKVEIFTIQGQKILETNNSNVNVSNLSPGLYLLKVYNQEGKVGVKRFIKK